MRTLMKIVTLLAGQGASAPYALVSPRAEYTFAVPGQVVTYIPGQWSEEVEGTAALINAAGEVVHAFTFGVEDQTYLLDGDDYGLSGRMIETVNGVTAFSDTFVVRVEAPVPTLPFDNTVLNPTLEWTRSPGDPADGSWLVDITAVDAFGDAVTLTGAADISGTSYAVAPDLTNFRAISFTFRTHAADDSWSGEASVAAQLIPAVFNTRVSWASDKAAPVGTYAGEIGNMVVTDNTSPALIVTGGEAIAQALSTSNYNPRILSEAKTRAAGLVAYMRARSVNLGGTNNINRIWMTGWTRDTNLSETRLAGLLPSDNESKYYASEADSATKYSTPISYTPEVNADYIHMLFSVGSISLVRPFGETRWKIVAPFMLRNDATMYSAHSIRSFNFCTIANDETRIAQTEFGDGAFQDVSQTSPVSGTRYAGSANGIAVVKLVAPGTLAGAAGLRVHDDGSGNYHEFKIDSSGNLVYQKFASGVGQGSPSTLISAAVANGGTIYILVWHYGDTLTVRVLDSTGVPTATTPSNITDSDFEDEVGVSVFADSSWTSGSGTVTNLRHYPEYVSDEDAEPLNNLSLAAESGFTPSAQDAIYVGESWGGETIGAGDGAPVYTVTTTAKSGEGSLPYGLSLPGGCLIKFDPSLDGQYIDGGAGGLPITLRAPYKTIDFNQNVGLKRIRFVVDCGEIAIKNMRLFTNIGGSNGDCILWTGDCENFLVMNSTISASQDELMNTYSLVYGVRKVTFQDCMLAIPSGTPEEDHNMGPYIIEKWTKWAWLRTIFYAMSDRAPAMHNGAKYDPDDVAHLDMINNVLNFTAYERYHSVQGNYLNNMHIRPFGPSYDQGRIEFRSQAYLYDTAKLYRVGNKTKLTNGSIIDTAFNWDYDAYPTKSAYPSLSERATVPNPSTVMSAEDAYTYVLANAGAQPRSAFEDMVAYNIANGIDASTNDWETDIGYPDLSGL